MKSHKRCPVCKFDRTYAGPVCPKCAAVGYALDPESGRIKRKVTQAYSMTPYRMTRFISICIKPGPMRTYLRSCDEALFDTVVEFLDDHEDLTDAEFWDLAKKTFQRRPKLKVIFAHLVT